MRTPASIAGHPIHPMLVPLPIGIWIFALACDVISLWAVQAIWSTMALYSMIGGVVGALLAAVVGFIDLMSLKGRPKRTATAHMALNLVIVVAYVVNIYWRTSAGESAGSGPIWLSAVAVALLVVSG